MGAAKQINENTYIVDGIILTREGDKLIMEFKEGMTVHKLRINWEDARQMAGVLHALFLSN